ncbi:MAG: YihY/virulence factor BrkB family protein [Ktedonobacteraceae bacterium]|nr:YihY/virulence factor BrkB family protein [Ktedonobacteraceae bacterium]
MSNRTQGPSTNTKARTPSGLLENVQKGTQPLQVFFTKFNNDWSMSFAGLLAYNLLMAMVPIAIAIIAILGLILDHLSPHALNTIMAQIVNIFPGVTSQQNTVALAVQQLKKNAGILGLIAILLALFGGSRLFVTMEGCLDIIYRVRPRTVIRQNLMAIGMLLLFILLTPIMVIASSGPAVVLSLLERTPLNTIPGIGFLFSLGGIAGGLLVAFILFEAIYFIVPNQPISWRSSWKGAVIAAVLLEIFLALFPFYITHFLGGYGGQIGFTVILLLFFYYFAVILLLGAQINAFFEQVRPLPNDLATFVSVTASASIPPDYHQT